MLGCPGGGLLIVLLVGFKKNSSGAVAEITIFPDKPGRKIAAVLPPQEAAPEPEAEQPVATKPSMDLIAKLLRGESARPDES